MDRLASIVKDFTRAGTPDILEVLKSDATQLSAYVVRLGILSNDVHLPPVLASNSSSSVSAAGGRMFTTQSGRTAASYHDVPERPHRASCIGQASSVHAPRAL